MAVCSHSCAVHWRHADQATVTAIELYIWDITESIVTVVAASIPALRILVRKEVRLYDTPKLRHITTETPRGESFSKLSSGPTKLAQDSSGTEEFELKGKSERSEYLSV